MLLYCAPCATSYLHTSVAEVFEKYLRIPSVSYVVLELSKAAQHREQL